MPTRWKLSCLFVLLWLSLSGQPTYNSLAQDTIITKRGLLSNIYLLDGKRLTLEVMEFFMADHPSAHSQIKVAQTTEQLSIVGYGLGSIFLLGGALLHDDNPGLSRDLFFYGGVGMGSGLIFQIISNNYQKNAVFLYNQGIKSQYRNKSSAALYMGTQHGKAVVLVRF